MGKAVVKRWLWLAAVACHHEAATAPNAGEQRAAAVAQKLVGTAAPATSITTLDGETIDLATLYGDKPVYLKLWATWCIPCNEQMPAFEQLYERSGDQLAVIAVDVGLDDDPATVRAFRDQHGMKMPIVIDDGRLADALDLQVTPQHVVIGRDGKIAFVGHRDGEGLAAALARVMAAAPAPAGEVVRAEPVLRPVIQPGEVAHLVIDGRDLAQPKKRAIALFATWCESYLKDRAPASAANCERVRRQLDALRAEHPDLEVIGVANPVWTTPEDVRDYAKRSGWPVTLDADGAVFRAFDVHAFGTVVLINSDGKVARIVKPTDDLRAAIDALQ